MRTNQQWACETEAARAPTYKRLKQQVQDIAAALEESASIPVIKEQINLIEDIQADGWWDGVTLSMLEQVRLRLRSLVRLIEARKNNPVCTDFSDEMGEEAEVSLPGFTDSMSFDRFKEKARSFLRQHQDKEAIQKLRLNEPLSEADLAELEQILAESGTGNADVLQKAAEGGLGLFVRSLVGLDREAAKNAVSELLADEAMSANQVEFVNLIIDYLTEHGVIEPGMLYESPFTDLSPRGPDGLFDTGWVDRLIETLHVIRARTISIP